jgi:RNA polymerase sigma-70 factor (ECF subfamily)
MGQRLSRAKKKIATAKIPYRVPGDHELPDRLSAVLAAVYLIFTTGHHAPEGALGARVDLADEAVRLARVLAELMPDEPECGGLLALLLATHARRHARVDEAGQPVLLARQDRSSWDRAAIAEASVLLERELTRHRPGPYQIQAAIACLHGIAPAYPDTDWPQIAVLYSLLEEHLPTPVVRVNRAVAVAEVSGPAAALTLLDTVAADDVERWHLYWSTRANFLRRLGRELDARDAFDRALSCPMNDTDRRFLAGERNRA